METPTTHHRPNTHRETIVASIQTIGKGWIWLSAIIVYFLLIPTIADAASSGLEATPVMNALLSTVLLVPVLVLLAGFTTFIASTWNRNPSFKYWAAIAAGAGGTLNFVFELLRLAVL